MPDLVFEATSILCRRCGRRSYNANDILHRFCDNCSKWHETPADYELEYPTGIIQAEPPKELRQSTIEQIDEMVTAVAEFLKPDELDAVSKAISTNLDHIVQQVIKYGGRNISRNEWPRLLVHCARAALGEVEVEFQFTAKEDPQ